jgi:hypothetical protein
MDDFQITNPWSKLLATSVVGAVVYCALLIVLRPAVLDVCEEIVCGSRHASVTRIFALMRKIAIRGVHNHRL